MGKDTGFLARFLQNPLGFCRRAVYKTLIGPLKYRKGDHYDAPRYWSDRLSKYGLSILGPGDEGLSEEQNNEMYKEAEKAFLDLCRVEGVNFPAMRVLEIGLGNGFYTGLLHRAGTRDYLGVDITDVLFTNLFERFPGFRFVRKDIAEDELEGVYDAIFLIDVIQHIVTEEQLSAALKNVSSRLAPGGVFVVGPVMKEGRKSLYYVRAWTHADVQRHLPDRLEMRAPTAFRGAELLVFRG